MLPSVIKYFLKRCSLQLDMLRKVACLLSVDYCLLSRHENIVQSAAGKHYHLHHKTQPLRVPKRPANRFWQIETSLFNSQNMLHVSCALPASASAFRARRRAEEEVTWLWTTAIAHPPLTVSVYYRLLQNLTDSPSCLCLTTCLCVSGFEFYVNCACFLFLCLLGLKIEKEEKEQEEKEEETEGWRKKKSKRSRSIWYTWCWTWHFVHG